MTSASSRDDLLDPRVLVTGPKQEARPARAYRLVLVQRRLDPVGAFLVGAFAHELGIGRVEPLGGLGYAFVHVAEQGFGPRDPVLLVGPHVVSLSSPESG